MEIPEFLIEMSKQMHEQDNRITAHPIWQVRCKRYLLTEQGYNESHWELHSHDSEGHPVYSSKEGYNNRHAIEYLVDEAPDWCHRWAEEHEYNLEEFETLEDAFDAYFSFTDPHEDEWPEDWKVVYMQETEQVVRACLTEADANAFIVRKQHDYPHLYTYVETMYHCPQMIQLREWILSLTEHLQQVREGNKA